MNRRHFLGRSATISLAGLAMPLASFSDDAPVKIGVVGTGGRGTDLIRKLSTIERADIVAVCDNYKPHLERGAEAAGEGVRRYEVFQDMLEAGGIDAVVVAAPLYLHFEMCRDAIKAGYAVFCEKTMCHSIDEAIELAQLVNQSGAVFQVGLQRRASAIYRQAKAMVDMGMLGKILSIKNQWHRNGDWRRPVPVEPGHADWQTLEHKLNWRLYWKYSQGLMTELGSHQMDVASWMLGAQPARVIATGGNDYWRDGREVYDNVYGIYEYDLSDGKESYTTRVTYSSIQSNAFEGASELIMGTKGTLFLTEKTGLFYKEALTELPAGRVDTSRTTNAQSAAADITAGKTLYLNNDPWARRGKPYEINEHSNSTRDQLIAFLDCVQRNDPQTICDVNTGLNNTKTVLIANQAIKESRQIQFPS